MSLKIFVGRVLERTRRAEAAARLRALGAHIVDDVTPQTDVVVLGGFGQTRRPRRDVKRDAAARRKAEALGCCIWGEHALIARLNRAQLGPLGWVAPPTSLESCLPLTQACVVRVREPADFEPPLLDHFLAFVRAHVLVCPDDLDRALAAWGERAPFRTAAGVTREAICHPFTLELLCSGDPDGGYELRRFELGAAHFRSMVHIPAGNAESFVFTPGGDLAWRVSELSPGHTAEQQGICMLAREGVEGDVLSAFIEQ